MKNEYGQELDRNGYAPSVFAKGADICCICNRMDKPLQRHEVIHGPFRAKSKRYGCWITVCEDCHDLLHQGGALERGVKAVIQQAAMGKYGWNEEGWREKFGKSYL